MHNSCFKMTRNVVFYLFIIISISMIIYNIRERHHICSVSNLNSLELFLVGCKRTSELYKRVLISSMDFFWYSQVNISMTLLVEDTKQEIYWAEEMSRLFPYPRIANLKIPGGPFKHGTYHRSGHLTQQYMKFQADKYTSAEYIGILDSDTMFTTLVTEELLFINGKPVMHGFFGKPVEQWWSYMPAATFQMLGLHEAMRCMSHFPFIIKRNHIRDIREYLEKIHGIPLHKYIQKHLTSRLGEFNVMCNYLWYFHRDEYHWRLLEVDPSWNEIVDGQVSSFSEITEEMRVPLPRVSTHYKYIDQKAVNLLDLSKKLTLDKISFWFKEGYCTVTAFEDIESCGNVPRTQPLWSLFYFDRATWTWDGRCTMEQTRHVNNVANCYSDHVWNLKHVMRNVTK